MEKWTPEQVLTLKLVVWWSAAFLVMAFCRLYFAGPQASVSHVLSMAARAEPIWVLIVGILLGHWLWSL